LQVGGFTLKGLSMHPITVALADSDPIKLAAYQKLLNDDREFSVVARASTARGAAIKVKQLNPRILLININILSSENIVNVVNQFKQDASTIVVALTDDVNAENLQLDILSGGARGLLSRDLAKTNLPKALHALNQGEAWVTRILLGKFMDRVVAQELSSTH
jgi:two-component system, NarL family, nitrate/nitrite response regulator NarL